MFLYSLAHGLSLSVVCRAFGVPRSTVHRVIHRIAAEIKTKLGTLISLPSQDMLPDIGMGFCQLARSPVFTRAAGAIDGCHIRIKPPGNQHRADYINYKLFPSIQLQATCDATGRFLDISVGYPGSVHDARVLRNTPIFSQALDPPVGFFLLADGGCPCLEKPISLITPYKLPLQGRVQECYNTHHSRARSVEGHAFQDTGDDILEMEDIEPEDHPVPLHVAPGRAETSGHHIRERIAAQLSAPALLPQHLQEHDYF
ncbi:hypothetical protein ABVT39_007801 [Epinephelus coioides]